MPAPDGYSTATLKDFVGHDFGASAPVTVGQARIDGFADVTGDHQWIHVDVEQGEEALALRRPGRPRLPDAVAARGGGRGGGRRARRRQGGDQLRPRQDPLPRAGPGRRGGQPAASSSPGSRTRAPAASSSASRRRRGSRAPTSRRSWARSSPWSSDSGKEREMTNKRIETAADLAQSMTGSMRPR